MSRLYIYPHFKSFRRAIPAFIQFYSNQMSDNNQNQQTEEEEYIPPAKRLITPADVEELDPDMTVRIAWMYLHLGAVPRGNAGMQNHAH